MALLRKCTFYTESLTPHLVGRGNGGSVEAGGQDEDSCEVAVGLTESMYKKMTPYLVGRGNGGCVEVGGQDEDSCE